MPPKQLVLKHDPHILLETLHEDDHVLAIAKPFGVLAHPSPGFWARGTLAHALVGRVSKEMMEERGNHNEWLRVGQGELFKILFLWFCFVQLLKKANKMNDRI